MPAIKEVALSSDVPLGPHLTRNFRLRDVPPPSDPDEWIAEGREISANYLHTLGITIRLGRGFNESDLGGKPVAVVNQAFVRQFLRGKMALSTQICVPSGTECIWREIVGVAADVRDTRVDSPSESAYFIPFSQAPKEFMADAVFTLLTVESPVAVQKELYALKMPPNTVTTAPFTLEQIREMQTESQRARLPVLAGMGVLALFLAAMGVYGIVAATIASRRREIGIRIAVGASPQIIQRLFIRKMSYTVGVGLFMGAYGAALMMRFMNGATWSLSETALATYCGAAFVVSIAAAVATLVAARSALAGNPSDSLRSEP